jgi:hypothetical protein
MPMKKDSIMLSIHIFPEKVFKKKLRETKGVILVVIFPVFNYLCSFYMIVKQDQIKLCYIKI